MKKQEISSRGDKHGKAKYGKYLFPQIIPKEVISQQKKPNNKIEISSDIAEKWQILKKNFEQILKVDPKEITTLLMQDREYTEEKCIQACSFFTSFVDSLEAEFAEAAMKPFQENLMKCYVFTLTNLNAIIINSICDQKSNESLLSTWIERRQILNDFLLFILQDSLNIFPFDSIIVNSIFENLVRFSKGFSNEKQVGESIISLFIYYQLQLIAIIAAFNQSKKSRDADETIKKTLEIMENAMVILCSTQQLREICSISVSNSETWIRSQSKIKSIAIQYGKKKIGTINMRKNNEDPIITIRYANLYYLVKILKLLKSRKIIRIAEQAIETLAFILKGNTLLNDIKNLDKLIIETVLNENVIAMKLLIQLLSNMDNPYAALTKYEYSTILRKFIKNHILASLFTHNISLPFLNPDKGDLQKISYKEMKDYVPLAFSFLNELKHFGSSKKSTKIIKTSMNEFIEVLMGELVALIDKIEGNDIDILIVKAHIVEFFAENANNITLVTTEYIVQLLVSNSFHYTSPKSIKECSEKLSNIETELERDTSMRLVWLLNTVINHDKFWSTAIFHTFMAAISQSYDKEDILFGLYKLIYCTLTSEVHDNNSFYSQILQKSPKQMDYATFLEKDKLGERKSIVAFIEIKGIHSLFSFLFSAYSDAIQEYYFGKPPQIEDEELVEKPEKKFYSPICITLTEQLLIHLHCIPLFAEDLISEPQDLFTLLEFATCTQRYQEVAMTILQELMISCKYCRNLAIIQPENNDYFPLTLLHFAPTLNKNRSPAKLSSTIYVMQLIVNFLKLDPESVAITIHQNMYFRTQIPLIFFGILKGNT